MACPYCKHIWILFYFDQAGNCSLMLNIKEPHVAPVLGLATPDLDEHPVSRCSQPCRGVLTAGDVAVTLTEVAAAEPASPAGLLGDAGRDLDAAVVEKGSQVRLVGAGGGAAPINVPLVDFNPAAEADPFMWEKEEERFTGRKSTSCYCRQLCFP